MKKIVIYVILFSMTLHCASRIGFLSSLHQQRHKIAYVLGLISEVPIAMCNSHYNFNQELVLEDDVTTNGTLPPIAFSTQEIHLFCNDFTNLSINSLNSISLADNQSQVIDHAYKTPALSIFHPPS